MKKMILFLYLLCLPSLYGDVIYLKNGSQLSGQVEKETSKKVYYYLVINGKVDTSSRQDEDSANVKEIKFTNAPLYYTRGMKAYKNGNYRGAVAAFAKLRRGKFLPYGKYFSGISYQKLGAFDQAIGSFRFFRGLDHRLAPKGLYSLGKVYLQDQKYRKAKEVFGEMIKKNYGKYWKLMATYGMGQALLNLKKYREARRKFDDAYRSSRGKSEEFFKELANLAQQGKGLALVGEKKYRDARGVFLGILKSKYSNSETLAGSYLGLGKVYYGKAQGGSKGDYKKALLCFLRVMMFYGGFKSKAVEAKGLAIDCFRKLGQNQRAEGLKNR